MGLGFFNKLRRILIRSSAGSWTSGETSCQARHNQNVVVEAAPAILGVVAFE